MLIAVALILFVLIVASTWWFGLWSNLITLVNLLLSAMLASSIYEPISDWLISLEESYSALYDFVAVWAVFCISFIVLRGITDVVSSYRLKFDSITELVGRSVLSIWIALVFICFSFFTLQMAPLTPDTYQESVNKSELGTMPDRAWLAFIQSRSRGALSASTAKGLFPEYDLPQHPDDIEDAKRVFDPFAEFLPQYAQRRKQISKQLKLRIGGEVEE